jgi:ectoine hydroxylase-related dioxygenase (phytanoyl-CoA dioxygenase family)
MDHSYQIPIATTGLPPAAATELDECGFVVLPNFLPPEVTDEFARVYDAAMACAKSTDVRVGRTSTRVTDFFNRDPAFEHLCFAPCLFGAATLVIGPEFKLSALHARTLHPDVEAQELHVDVPRHSPDWPLLGFIVMVDAFLPENGATRFIPGSHRWLDPLPLTPTESDNAVLAFGPAGSMLVFNGSTWHGHSSNRSSRPRRSLQGAFIPRTGKPATDFLDRMHVDTQARLGPVALRVLGL